jgi:sphinganine-1-phosphate aldolase
MSKKHNWHISKLQRPPGAHLAITDANQESWQNFVHSLQDCVSMMKEDKSLNSNDDTALYGLTGSIPDKSLLREFVAIH